MAEGFSETNEYRAAIERKKSLRGTCSSIQALRLSLCPFVCKSTSFDSVQSQSVSRNRKPQMGIPRFSGKADMESSSSNGVCDQVPVLWVLGKGHAAHIGLSFGEGHCTQVLWALLAGKPASCSAVKESDVSPRMRIPRQGFFFNNDF